MGSWTNKAWKISEMVLTFAIIASIICLTIQFFTKGWIFFTLLGLACIYFYAKSIITDFNHKEYL